jgi:transcription elongation factor GreA
MKSTLPTPKRIPFTKQGYQEVLDEKAKLLSERPDAVEHLNKARSMGDLSENGYYHAAKSRLRGIDSRLRHLEILVRLGKIVEASTDGAVHFGNTVVITDGTKHYEYTVVGGYESDPAKKTVSHISPIGKALMNKKIGDVITVHAPNGSKQFTVTSIR